jgi:hypothetical protein
MNSFIQKNKTNNSEITIDAVFGKYIIDNNFINWYLNYENDIKDLYTELLNISESNGISIDDNNENFNSFIIMMYNESQYS